MQLCVHVQKPGVCHGYFATDILFVSGRITRQSSRQKRKTAESPCITAGGDGCFREVGGVSGLWITTIIHHCHVLNVSRRLQRDRQRGVEALGPFSQATAFRLKFNVDMAHRSPSQSQSGKASDGRRGPRQVSNVRVSKALSWLLRHGAEKEGVPIDSAGYCLVDDVLTTRRLRDSNLEELRGVTAASEKQRFHMKEEGGKWYIRANQGHSIAAVRAEELLEKLDPSYAEEHSNVYHGTYSQFWESILAVGGLNKMTRNHIHFATNVPEVGKVKSGMRKTCDLIVRVDLTNPDVWDGIEWFRAANDVVLTSGIEGTLPLELVADVTRRDTGAVVYSND